MRCLKYQTLGSTQIHDLDSSDVTFRYAYGKWCVEGQVIRLVLNIAWKNFTILQALSGILSNVLLDELLARDC